jgi:DNA-binding response OmpR family regulator
MPGRVLVVDDSPTIRRVVRSILEARAYQALLAEDGQAALDVLASEKVDLVLLDFVMPRMNGYQFCRELRSRKGFEKMPVVLMSAKGDKIRGQFVQQTGAIDAITKPFDARGLVAVVEAALRRVEDGRVRRLSEAPPREDDTLADSLKPTTLDLSDDPALRRVQAAYELATAVAQLVVPELCSVPDVPRDAHRRFTEAIQRAILPENLIALSSLLKTLELGEGTRDVLSGDISVISIAEVLQLLQLQRLTGALTVARRGAEITIHVREGNVDLARAHGRHEEEYRLSRYLVEGGALQMEQLDRALADASGTKQLLGEVLVDRGLATRDQVKTALIRQTSDLVYEVVRWTQGRFTFAVGVSAPEVQAAALGLPTGAVVMEGFRRVDEWRLIEGSFDFEEVLYRDMVAGERIAKDSKLTAKERLVLEKIDGERTVREIVDDMGGSPFDVCKILYQFLNSRLVRRKAA